VLVGREHNKYKLWDQKQVGEGGKLSLKYYYTIGVKLLSP
jgi:hypothetical protein